MLILKSNADIEEYIYNRHDFTKLRDYSIKSQSYKNLLKNSTVLSIINWIN